jgi:hypothetical protein
MATEVPSSHLAVGRAVHDELCGCPEPPTAVGDACPQGFFPWGMVDQAIASITVVGVEPPTPDASNALETLLALIDEGYPDGDYDTVSIQIYANDEWFDKWDAAIAAARRAVGTP